MSGVFLRPPSAVFNRTAKAIARAAMRIKARIVMASRAILEAQLRMKGAVQVGLLVWHSGPLPANPYTGKPIPIDVTTGKPIVITPKRQITLVIAHDTCGDDLFCPKVEDALAEFMTTGKGVDRDFYLASNGVHITCTPNDGSQFRLLDDASLGFTDMSYAPNLFQESADKQYYVDLDGKQWPIKDGA